MKDSDRKEMKNRMFAWAYGRQDGSRRESVYAEQARLYEILWGNDVEVVIIIDDIVDDGVIDLDPADWHEVPILKKLPDGT